MADRFGGAKPALTLVNPIAAELAVMRPTIIANLLAAAGRNAARGQPDVALFEVGPIFRDAAPGAQDLVATVLRAGQTGPRHWAAKPRAVDAYDIKGDALSLLETLGAPAGNLQVSTDAPAWFHPGRSGSLRLGASVLAQFGEIHPAILDALGIKGPVVAAEIWIERIPAPKRKGPAKPMLVLSQLQKVTRDFAFMVGRDVPADKLIKAVRAADKALITDAAVFDLYQGPNLPAGQQSVAISVTLTPAEKTLTEAEIEAVAKKIVDGVAAATGAVLR